MNDELVERVARALCKRSGVDPDSSDAIETWRYGKDYPNGIMTVGRYEKGWYHADPSLKPRNPSGRLAWTWFTQDAVAAIEAMEMAPA